MTSSVLARLFAVAVLIAQVSAVCYLEDTSQTCSVCWVTKYANAEDSVGVTKMSECPDTIVATYDVPPPVEMFEKTDYPVTFSLQKTDATTEDNHGIVKKNAAKEGEEENLLDVPHANIHSCIASRGACTPFVSNTPGLSTHTPADKGDLKANGLGTFKGNVNLDMDTYIIIAHIRFFVADPDSGKAMKYDVATGIQRDVLEQVAEISTDAYIMAGVVGFILCVFGGAIGYMVKKRILDLDKIMAMLFSDAVTLPVDVVCGLADASAFTVSLIIVMDDKNLLNVIPICWLFCGIAWLVSLHNGFFDCMSMYYMLQEKNNRAAFEERMMTRMSAKWLQRRPSQAAGVNKAGKKNMVRKLSDEMASMTGSSEEHHNAMVDFDRADRDFHRRKRTIAGIILEGVPITALQAYILIEGENMETVAVLALLLAALLLGTSMQGLGDYGHAKKRREDALAKFDSMFGSQFQDTAGRTAQLWKQASVADMEAGLAAQTMPAPGPPPPAEVAVVRVGTE